MLATFFTSRTRALSFGFLFPVALGTACQSDPAKDSNGDGGGSAGAPASGGSAGTSSGTSGAGPTGGSSGTAGAPAGGSSGAASGGSPTGGTAGSSGSSGATSGGSAGMTGGAAGTSGASGASGTGGTGGDPCASAIFCEDFDDFPANATPPSPWALQRSGSATAVVDQMHRVSGSQSVKFDVPTGPGRAYIALANAPVFPVPGNAFYGRVMTWLQAAPTTAVHWTIVEAGGLVPMQTYHAVYRLGGQHPIMEMNMFAGSQLMANYETPDGYSNNGPRSDCWDHANRVVLPTARWACVEWFYDGPNNAITLWVDGTQVIDLRGTGEGCVSQPATYTWTAPAFDTLRLGWESYQTDTARTLWIDDVAVSTTRVGCPSDMGQ